MQATRTAHYSILIIYLFASFHLDRAKGERVNRLDELSAPLLFPHFLWAKLSKRFVCFLSEDRSERPKALLVSLAVRSRLVVASSFAQQASLLSCHKATTKRKLKKDRSRSARRISPSNKLQFLLLKNLTFPVYIDYLREFLSKLKLKKFRAFWLSLCELWLISTASRPKATQQASFTTSEVRSLCK